MPKKPAGPKREKKVPMTMKGKSSKKSKKRNPWSDSENDIDSMGDMSDVEDFKGSALYIFPTRAVPRRTAGKGALQAGKGALQALCPSSNDSLHAYWLIASFAHLLTLYAMRFTTHD